jgi:hypothetical protein
MATPELYLGILEHRFSNSMRNANADLDTALSFVIGRIEEEATRSGEPLDDEERHLLRHLPTATAYSYWTTDAERPIPLPRDIVFEKLVASAKDAYLNDVQAYWDGRIRWELAAAVLKLNRHPLLWLLEWAGFQVKPLRPRHDRLLLVGTALLFTVIMLAGMIWVDSRTGPQAPIRWAVFGCGYVGICALLYFVTRKFEERQLRRKIENYKHDLQRGGSSVLN